MSFDIGLMQKTTASPVQNEKSRSPIRVGRTIILSWSYFVSESCNRVKRNQYGMTIYQAYPYA